MTAQPLTGRRILVPESRELDLFTAMLERQGASVLRCPLVLILPLEDTAGLDAWIGRLAGGGHDLVVFYTGEGVTRTVARAETLGQREAVIAALAQARKAVRGPKPIAALRRLALAPDAVAQQPTTDGLVALLSGMDLRGLRAGVQLYPGNDGTAIRQALADGGASFDPVTPYRYASDEEDGPVAAAIREMAGGGIDLVAFTSSPQVRRLTDVATRFGLTAELARALETTRIAAVGPVVAEAVSRAGGVVQVQPPANFHLKPLVAEIVRVLG